MKCHMIINNYTRTSGLKMCICVGWNNEPYVWCSLRFFSLLITILFLFRTKNCAENGCALKMGDVSGPSDAHWPQCSARWPWRIRKARHCGVSIFSTLLISYPIIKTNRAGNNFIIIYNNENVFSTLVVQFVWWKRATELKKDRCENTENANTVCAGCLFGASWLIYDFSSNCFSCGTSADKKNARFSSW